MELKKAVAVCLISFFSATLVLLIARSLDLQTSARLELQLTKIAEELHLLRTNGGVTVASGGSIENPAIAEGVIVYYFHSNVRCLTCRAIEKQAHDALQLGFAAELKKEQIFWKVLNYDQPIAAELTKKFDIQTPVVVLVRMKDGKIDDWNRLDDVWVLVDEKPAFRKYVQSEIRKMLTTPKPQAEDTSNDSQNEKETLPPSTKEESPPSVAPVVPDDNATLPLP